MANRFNIFWGFLVFTGFLFSCVPPKHFAEVSDENDECKRKREELIKENETLTVENTELKSKLEISNKEIDRVKESNKSEKEELKVLKSRYQTLNSRYEELQKTHQSMISGSDAETRQLMQQLETTQANLYQREDQLNQLAKKIDNDRAELDRMQQELELRNQRLIELEDILSRRDREVNLLKNKVTKALLGFENDGLTITKKNGKVYVSLEEKLLFKSGSTEVDPRGVSALKKLAGVLEQNPDINITIEGHTDDVPVIPGSKYEDNWDLSVSRSTEIIRILLDGSSINPARLTAAGRSKYQPVDSRKTAAARQKNRRTEIILTPDLDELFKILESQ